MKAMIAGFAGMIVISIGAWIGLGELGLTSQAVNSSDSVRID